MNRKVLLLVTMAMLVSVMPLYGQFAGPGSSVPVNVDVKSILANPVDDTWVTLKGHILEKVGRKYYMFSDGTGQIRLDIDNKYFPAGVTIKILSGLSANLRYGWSAQRPASARGMSCSRVQLRQNRDGTARSKTS